MYQSTEDAIEFHRALAAFAERLAAHDLVIRSLHSEWAHFGSWAVQVTSGDAEDNRGQALLEHNYAAAGPVIIEAVWDGREHELLIRCTSSGVLSMHNQWQQMARRSLESSVAAMDWAEQYFVGHCDDA